MRYIIYCRRSQDREDKQILSLASQEAELRALADRLDLKVVKVLQESKSAKKAGRPVFNQMLQMIDKKEADGIICWKFDRLTRNPTDTAAIAERLQASVIKKIVTSEKEYKPDDNVLLMYVEAGMANQYIIDLSRNVKRGMRAKVQQGWLPNRPTTGWMYDKNSKTIVRDEYNFPRVKKLLELALTGKYNTHDLMRIANRKLIIRHRSRGKLSDKDVTKNYISETVRNPFHAGVILYNGERFPGAHEAMITQQEHERLLKLYGTIGKRDGNGPMTKFQERPRKRDYKLGGVMRCANCGRQVSGWGNKNRPGGKWYVYYHCSSRFNGKKYYCGAQGIRSDRLENMIRTILNLTQIDGRLIEWVKENLDKAIGKEEQEQKEMMTSLKKRKEQLEISKKRLVDHLLSGTVSDEAYRLKDEEISNEIREIVEQVEQEGLKVMKLKEESRHAVKIADRLVEIFDGADFAKVKQMLKSVFSSMKLKDGNPVMALNKPFQVIADNKDKEFL